MIEEAHLIVAPLFVGEQMGLFDRSYYDKETQAMVEIGEAELQEWERPDYYECEPGKLSVILYRGFAYHRTFFNWREKILADAWEKENRSQSLLNTLMGHRGEQASQRDERVAAEVIQWLGSNCGWCFISEAMRVMGYKVEHDLPTDDPSRMAEVLTSRPSMDQDRAKKIIAVQYWCKQNEVRYSAYKGRMRALLEQKFEEEIRRKVENIDEERLWEFQGTIELDADEEEWALGARQQTARF